MRKTKRDKMKKKIEKRTIKRDKESEKKEKMEQNTENTDWKMICQFFLFGVQIQRVRFFC